jgi:hypothetical protein
MTSDNGEEGRRYAATPQLHLLLTVIEMISGCAGVLDVRLTAQVQATRIVATDHFMGLPFMEIWTNRRWFRSSHSAFEQFAINTGEQVFKGIRERLDQVAALRLASLCR